MKTESRHICDIKSQ